jgi:hypothetical protein
MEKFPARNGWLKEKCIYIFIFYFFERLLGIHPGSYLILYFLATFQVSTAGG